MTQNRKTQSGRTCAGHTDMDMDLSKQTITAIGFAWQTMLGVAERLNSRFVGVSEPNSEGEFILTVGHENGDHTHVPLKLK